MLRGKWRSRQAVSPCSAASSHVHRTRRNRRRDGATSAAWEAVQALPPQTRKLCHLGRILIATVAGMMTEPGSPCELDFRNRDFRSGDLHRTPARFEIPRACRSEYRVRTEAHAASSGRLDRSRQPPWFCRPPTPSLRDGNPLSSSTRPSMLPPGRHAAGSRVLRSLRVRSWSAKHERRDCRRRDPSGHNLRPVHLIRYVNGTFRTID